MDKSALEFRQGLARVHTGIKVLGTEIPAYVLFNLYPPGNSAGL